MEIGLWEARLSQEYRMVWCVQPVSTAPKERPQPRVEPTFFNRRYRSFDTAHKNVRAVSVNADTAAR
jgi:hypothetical protein